MSNKDGNRSNSPFTEATRAARVGLQNTATSTTLLARQASTSTAKLVANTVIQVKGRLRKVNENHEQLADHADTLSKVTRVAASAAVIGAVVAAPTGLAAVGTAVGVISAPLIVTAAPILAAVAGGAITVSAAASLYSKARRQRQRQKKEI